MVISMFRLSIGCRQATKNNYIWSSRVQTPPLGIFSANSSILVKAKCAALGGYTQPLQDTFFSARRGCFGADKRGVEFQKVVSGFWNFAYMMFECDFLDMCGAKFRTWAVTGSEDPHQLERNFSYPYLIFKTNKRNILVFILFDQCVLVLVF